MGSRNSGVSALLGVVCILFAGSAGVRGQGLPDTMWIPVTFYDYRADGSNPDFQACCCGVVTGQVKSTLSEDRKPLFNENILCNTHVEEWFRPSGADGPATNSQFGYNPAAKRWEWTNLVARPGGTAGEYVSTEYDPSYDMATIVIYDSLPFLHVPSVGLGVYQFTRDAFFWIDNRGFGNEPGSEHNFGFAMELHYDFTYQPGLTFDFVGDDDVWVFINDSLVLDIGGIHVQEPGSFNVDNIPGLEVGKSYGFDFFYAERHTGQSTIQVTTNLLTPMTLELIVRNDTVTAGSLTRVDAAIRDSSGIRQPEKESQTKWQLLDPSAPGDTITNSSGASTELGGTKAYRRVMVQATYQDPDDPDYTLEGRAFVYVGPGPADHVWIEKLLSDSLTNSLNAPDTVERISVSLNEDSATAYAVLRDKYGNYVDLARSAQWSSESPSKIGAKPTQGKKWIGIVSRGTGGQATDSARITASQGGLKSDKAWAVVEFKLQVATPTIYPPGGDFAGSITIDSITSATDGAIIWYTTDGSTPEPYESNTLRYSRGETITISNNGETIVKAIATHTDETRYNPSEMAQEVYVNIDNVGPAITRVRYYLANPPGKTGNEWDTLIVRFNEPVKAAGLKGQSPSAVFSYFDFDDPGFSEDRIFSNWRYSDVTQRDLDTATAGVRSITILLGEGSMSLITPVEDSMQIKGGTVADRYGNPSPANGAKVKIEWGRDYSYVTKSAPNPFVPGRDEVPKAIRDNIDQSGTTEPIPKQATIVQVSSVTRLDPKGSYGYIYDAVGNQVSEKLSFFPTGKNSKQFYLFWDGRNRNNRFVSSGTYLAMIYIKEIDRDRVSIKRQKIGVKR